MIAAARYGLNENQVYGATAALLILSGILFRRFRPVMVRREGESGGWDVDWFHILVIFVLIPMAWEAGRGWQCAYILLTALYVLQFAVLEHWKRAAFTLAAALAAAAFWRQPFIRWPEMLSLEIQLIPAAGFIWSLGRIWGDRKEITNLQTVLYCLCLGAMGIGCLIYRSRMGCADTGGCQSGCVPPGAYEKMYEMDSDFRHHHDTGGALHDKKISGSACMVGLVCWQPDWDSLSLPR
mgnify:FL=1